MQDSCASGSATAVADGPVPPKPATILVVDDDPNIPDAMMRQFRPFHVKVLPAYHGMQGLALATSQKPDLIIIDLRMPRGPGDYVVECLKRNARTRHIPIIVLTGQPSGYMKHRLAKLGIDAYLNKPVQFDELREVVERFVSVPEKAPRE